MYTRITRTGDRQYLQLVESFRNDRGQVRVRVVANLGRLDKLSAENLDPLINGLTARSGALKTPPRRSSTNPPGRTAMFLPFTNSGASWGSTKR